MKTIGSIDDAQFHALVTCPPMLLSIGRYEQVLSSARILAHCPEIRQIMSLEHLLEAVPKFDGWIIGDDPATAEVFQIGSRGKLRAAVKWGVGVDNVDFKGAELANIPVANTPGMFSDEVADMAAGYVIALSRRIVDVHNGIVAGGWPKPVGMSLRGKQAAVVGYGNIGREIVNRLLSFGMTVNVYDPFLDSDQELPVGVTAHTWPQELVAADFIVLACSLTEGNYHLINADILGQCKQGVRLVNVSRGPLIREADLLPAIREGKVAGAALDVSETEPRPVDCPLRNVGNCIFGSHNGSNTQEAVDRTSIKAIDLLHGFLNQ